MKNILILAFLIVTVIISSCTKSSSDGGGNTGGGPYFPKVKNVIKDNCLSCHSPGGAGMPTNLTIDENIVSLAAKIKAATIDPVSPSNKRMPQGGELSQADKDIILKWFNAGGTAND